MAKRTKKRNLGFLDRIREATTTHYSAAKARAGRGGSISGASTSYKGYRVYPVGDSWRTSLGHGDSDFDSKADVKRFIDSWNKAGKPNPGTGAFERCVKAVTEKGGAYDPRAVCAAAGRRKYGAKKFAAMAKAGWKRAARRNPEAEAMRVSEEFHGRPVEELVKVSEKRHYHKYLAELGKLRKLMVLTNDGEAKVMLSKFRGALLCANEAKNQLFVTGGDQSVDLGEFGIDRPHEVETLGQVLEIWYDTTKEHLGDEGGKALYFHVSGTTNRGGKHVSVGWPPDLIYHLRDETLEFSGGSYEIRAEGIDK